MLLSNGYYIGKIYINKMNVFNVFHEKINDWSAKMSLTKFEILSTVVEEDSLTKAAESLSMT